VCLSGFLPPSPLNSKTNNIRFQKCVIIHQFISLTSKGKEDNVELKLELGLTGHMWSSI